MLCFHKGVARLATPIPQVLQGVQSFYAFKRRFWRQASGNYTSDNDTFNNLRITLKTPDIIIVQNSIHKYLQNGFNVFDLSYNDCINGLVNFYSSLGVTDVNKVNIYKLEVECPIQVSDAETVFNSLISYRNKSFLQLMYAGKVYGKFIQTDNYKLKVYSKHLQMKGDPKTLLLFSNTYPDQQSYLKQTLRIELQILKSRYAGLNRPITIKDITDVSFIRKIYSDMIFKLSHSIVEMRPDINLKHSKNQLISQLLHTHPNKELLNHFKTSNYRNYRYSKQLYQNSLFKQHPLEDLVSNMTTKVQKLLENTSSDCQNTQHVHSM